MPQRFPPSRVSESTDLLYGVPVPDPYRWLEDGKDAAVAAWTEAQNGLTERYLAESPQREAIRTRLERLLAIGFMSTPAPVRGRYFYQYREGTQNQPVLLVRQGLHGTDRVLLDPNTLNPAGTTALDWCYPSEDGRLLAYGLSEDGSEDSVLRVLEVDTGRNLPDIIERTRAADLAWLPDGSGFYYTRYPEPGSVPEGDEHYHRAVYFHRLGEDSRRDRLVFRPEVKEHWPGVSLAPDGRWLVLSVARSFDETDLYLMDVKAGGPLVPVVRDLPALFDAHVVHDRLYIRTNLDAPTYRLFLADPERPDRSTWREIVPARPDAVLEGVAVARDRMLLSYLERATSRLRLADLDAGNLTDVPLPAIGSLYGLGVEWDGVEAMVGFTSFSVPPTVYHLDLATGALQLWRRVEADFDPTRFTVEQVTFPSRDGTAVSMFMVYPAAAQRDGKGPTYLTGYGGFNISMTPAFSRSLLLWLEAGGILAVPNLRGGGEYGERWHQAGMLVAKQNTFDDFVSAAEHLIAWGWTSPAYLAIAGGSNGGLLMGAVLTQRPDLFRAVVIQVPLLDMIRYHRFLIARLWIPEYGSADDPEQFRWLMAYSPYHHVVSGTHYPAVLLATAESDTRVDPLHARKMTALLQAATASDHPVLLRLETKAGHGAGKPVSKLVEELTDCWTFVFRELGVSLRG